MPGDLEAGLRVLLACPPSRRAARAAALLRQAAIADRFRQRSGQAHPRYGSGSLMSAALRHPRAPLPDHCDASYRACLSVLLCAIAARCDD